MKNIFILTLLFLSFIITQGIGEDKVIEKIVLEKDKNNIKEWLIERTNYFSEKSKKEIEKLKNQSSSIEYRAISPDYDLISFVVDMDIDMESREISHHVEIKFEAQEDNLESVNFYQDPSLEVVRVADENNKELLFNQKKNYYLLNIEFLQPINSGEQKTIYVDLFGKINCGADPYFGMQFCQINPNLTYSTTSWYPGKDYRSPDFYDDIYETYFNITVPDNHQTASIGKLIQVIDNKDGTKTHKWYQERGQFETAFASAPYSTATSYYNKSIPISTYTYTDQQSRNNQEYAEIAKEAVNFYSKIFTPFLFNKLDVVAVSNKLGGGVAMSTIVFVIGDSFTWNPDSPMSESLSAHEISHEWWGWTVLSSGESTPWLWEGAAEFSSLLYTDYRWKDTPYSYIPPLVYDWYAQYYFYYVDPKKDVPIGAQAIYGLDTWTYTILTYYKGAWVYRMMKYILQDELFFKGVQKYVEDNKLKPVGTDDLRKALETVSSQNLQWFFNEWVYTKGFPTYAVGFTYDKSSSGGYDVKVSIDEDKTFDMPVEIEIFTSDENEVILKTERILQPTQEFSYHTNAIPLQVTVDYNTNVLKRVKSKVDGDINLNGQIDGIDLILLGYTMGSSFYGNTDYWYQGSDLNFDGSIDDKDLAILEENFGKINY